MHADDHRPGLALRVPAGETQPRAVEADDVAGFEARAGEGQVRLAGMLQGRSAGGEAEREGDRE